MDLFLNPKRTERREEKSAGCTKLRMENKGSSRDRMRAVGKDEKEKSPVCWEPGQKGGAGQGRQGRQRCPITGRTSASEDLTGNDPPFTSPSAKEKTTFPSSSPNPPLYPPPFCPHPTHQQRGKNTGLAYPVPGFKAQLCHMLTECPWVFSTSLPLKFHIYEMGLMILTSKDWCQDYMVNCFLNTRCVTYWLIIIINQIIIIIIINS